MAFSDNYIAMIDGATSKTLHDVKGMTGGSFVAKVIQECLPRMPGALDGAELVEAITQKVDALLPDIAWKQERPNAVAAILSLQSMSITTVGDIGVMINGHGAFHEKEIDQVMSRARSAYSQAIIAEHPHRLEQLRSSDPGREFIFPLLSSQHVFQNNAESAYGYGCIDGTSVPMKFIEVANISSGDEVVLATDGYPALCQSLGEAEAYLSQSLKEDPMRIGAAMGTKGFNSATQASFDDRSYLRIVIN